jgi:isobutyryl-CoA mutase
VQLARGTEQEKQSQLARLRDFHEHHADDAADALDRLHQAVLTGSNVFTELMHAARVCSLGQITDAFYQVGGQYRRNV